MVCCVCLQKPPEEELITVTPEPMSDEVSELQQRLLTLQQKRVEDKTRIKELERYKAQFMQVNPPPPPLRHPPVLSLLAR